MARDSVRGALLRRAPDEPVELLASPVLVRVRAVYGRAIATTPTSVLHEWVRYGEYHCRWDAKWQVHPVAASEWAGEALE